MCCVTLLVSGVPHNVTLTDLGYDIWILLNTDEIGIFEVRELAVHPRTYRRQIALDFPSGFDAMAAQEKLDGYTYSMANGQEYRLSARINRSKQHARPQSPHPERSGRWDVEQWPALALIPNVADDDMVRAHAQLDAQLEILNKHKLILETEKEILEKQRYLKREYRLMHGYDSGTEASTSKRSRSGSLEQPSSSSHTRSRSREVFISRQPRDYTLPELPWHEEPVRIRELRSHSKERHSCSRSQERDRWERSSRDERREDWRPSQERYYRSKSRERVHRDRSASRESYKYRQVSAQDLKQFRDSVVVESRSKISHIYPKERSHSKRSRPLAIMPNIPERSKSPHSRPCIQTTVTKKDAGNLPSYNISGSNKNVDGNRNINTDNINKETETNKIRDDTHTLTSKKDNEHNEATRENSHDKNKIDKERKQLEEKVESITKDVMFLVLILLEEIFVKDQIKISKTDKLLLDKNLVAIVKTRVEPLARVRINRDIDVLRQYKALYPRQDDLSMLKAMLDKIPKIVETKNNEPQGKENSSELKNKDENENITRSSNTLDTENIDLFDNTKKSTETDSKTNDKCDTASVGNKENAPRVEVKTEIDEEIVAIDIDDDTANTNKDADGTSFLANSISKPNALNNLEPVIVSNRSQDCFKTYRESANIVETFENKNNIPRIAVANNKEPQELVVIDIDSAEKPVPKRPQFVLGIKMLLKELTKVIKDKNLIEQIPIFDLKYVLRDILRKLMKGKAYLSNKEVIKQFRNIYPREEDENFIKTIIQDLKDGKYPGLTNVEEDDCEDDVILIEKKYDVVTIEDSDDDQNELKPTEISLERKSEESTAQNEPCPSNNASIELNNPGTSDPSHLVIPGQVIPGPVMSDNPIPSISVPISTIQLQPNPEPTGLKPSELVQTENSQSQTLNEPSVAKLSDHPSPTKDSSNPEPSCLKPGCLEQTKPGKEIDNSVAKIIPVLPSPNKVINNPEPKCLKPSCLDQIPPGKEIDSPSVDKLKPVLRSPHKVTPANPQPSGLKPVCLDQTQPGKECDNPAKNKPVLPCPNKVAPAKPQPSCLKPGCLDPTKAGKAIDNSVAKIKPVLSCPNKVAPAKSQPSCLKPGCLDPTNAGKAMDNSVAKIKPVLPNPNKVTPANPETLQSRWDIGPGVKPPTNPKPPITANPEPSCLMPTQIRPTQPNANIKSVKTTPNQVQQANPKPSCTRPIQIPTQSKIVTDAAKSRIPSSSQNPTRFSPSQIRPIQPVTNIPSVMPFRPAYCNPMPQVYPKPPSIRPKSTRPNLTQICPATPVPSQYRPYNPNGPRPSQPKKKNKAQMPQIRPPYPNSFQGFPPNDPFWFGPVFPLSDQFGPRQSSKFANNPRMTFRGAARPTVKKMSGIASGKEDAHLQSRKGNGDTERETKRETSKDNKNAKEEKGGLKVTGITIVTSLTELNAIADNDKPKMEIPIESIKVERDDGDFESKTADPGPRVTSITIMTSDTELFSLGNETNEPKEIKDENIYDEIEETNDSGINIDDIVSGIDCTDGYGKGNNSNRSLENVGDKNNVARGNASSDVEDETIESIIKFVQSLV